MYTNGCFAAMLSKTAPLEPVRAQAATAMLKSLAPLGNVRS